MKTGKQFYLLMPLLKYSFYQKILHSSFTEYEQLKLIETIYAISFSYLKFHFDKNSSFEIHENTKIECAIAVTVSLLTKQNNSGIELANFIKNCEENILTESDFNYWVMVFVKKRTEEFIEIVLFDNQILNK